MKIKKLLCRSKKSMWIYVVTTCYNTSVRRILSCYNPKEIEIVRRLIIIFLTLVSINAFGGSVEESVTVQKSGDQYSINYFNYKAEVLAYFEKLGLQGGGYTWEALIKAAITTEAPEVISEIEFDPEGDAFFAYAANEVVADRVKTIIEKLSTNLVYREKYIDIATKGGYIE